MSDTLGATVWPALAVAAWRDTRDTLHRWTQIVGKVRLAHSPAIPHWWGVALYVTPRGITTSSIPHGNVIFAMDFDFISHQLVIVSSDGGRSIVSLEPRSVADFYTEVMGRLNGLGLSTSIWTMPVEIADAVPFELDNEHASYDPICVRTFWEQLVQVDRVLRRFRAGFTGKASPVHFFWGSFDLAVTRFSGRPAPPHPGGVPNVGNWVMEEAYSHEVSSAGFFPDTGVEGAFYSYAYPEPEGFDEHPVMPPSAGYDDEMGEFILPYEVVRTSHTPDATLLRFLQTTYEAAAIHAGWDRRALER